MLKDSNPIYHFLCDGNFPSTYISCCETVAINDASHFKNPVNVTKKLDIPFEISTMATLGKKPIDLGDC